MTEAPKRPRLAQGREHVVATVDEIPSGTHKLVPIGRHGVGVYNVNGTFYAIANYCPHQGGPLCSGTIWSSVRSRVPGDYEVVSGQKFIRCPWHGWEFDLATGRSWFDPRGTRVRSYEVSVAIAAELAEDADLVPGPYLAETYAVFAEGEYLILEVPS